MENFSMKLKIEVRKLNIQVFKKTIEKIRFSFQPSTFIFLSIKGFQAKKKSLKIH